MGPEQTLAGGSGSRESRAMPDLPPKLFFRIGEVAGLVGVEPHVLRYWEREFRSIRPTKSAKGQRVYSRKDVENLLRVRNLLYRDGFTIAGAKKKLQRPEVAVEPAAEPEATPETELEMNQRDRVEDAVTLHSAPASRGEADGDASPPLREKLLELRTEVEAFLAELTSTN